MVVFLLRADNTLLLTKQNSTVTKTVFWINWELQALAMLRPPSNNYFVPPAKRAVLYALWLGFRYFLSTMLGTKQRERAGFLIMDMQQKTSVGNNKWSVYLQG